MSIVATVSTAVNRKTYNADFKSQAVPVITSRFNSLHDVGWYGASYLLASAALQPLTGKIYARFDTKWTFISFFGLFEFGSLICGVATSSMMLIIGRSIAGMGGSGLINGGMQIIYQAVPDQRRPAIMGILMAISQIGLVGGPLLGGVLTEFVSWRWCFYINLPVGVLVFVCLAFINLPDRKVKPELELDENGNQKNKFKDLIHSLDLKGFTLFAGFSIMVVLALVWGGVDYAWSSATIIGLLVGGICTLALFCYQEYRIGDRAMFPWSVVKQTAVWCSSITMFVFFGSQMVGNYYLPIYFQTVRNASPAMSGVYTLPSIFGTMITAVLSGVLVSKWGYYLPMMVASGVLAGIGNGLLSMLDEHTSAVRWAWFQLITGFGRGFGMQMVSNHFLNHVHLAHAHTADHCNPDHSSSSHGTCWLSPHHFPTDLWWCTLPRYFADTIQHRPGGGTSKVRAKRECADGD
jgi:MFS family permease